MPVVLAEAPLWLQELWNDIINFRMFAATFGLYEQYVPAPLLYSILYVTILGVSYLKSRSVAVTGAASMITGAFFAALLPGDLQFFGGLVMFLGLAAIIYSVFRSK